MKLTQDGKKLYSGVFIDHGLSLAKAKARYRQRRKKLLSKIDHPFLLFGLEEGPGGKNIWPYLYSPIYQEPLLLYLTGVNQLNVALYLNPIAKKEEEKEILFLKDRDARFEFWQGLRLGVGDKESIKIVRDLTGIKTVLCYDDIEKQISKRLTKHKDKNFYLFWHEGKELIQKKGADKKKNYYKKKIILDSNYSLNQKFKKKLAKKIHKKLNFKNIATIQWEDRLCLDKVDIQNAQIANDLTNEAFKSLLKSMKNFKTETEVRGFIDGQLRMRSSYGQSFPTIAASGKNATILHYEKFDDSLKQDELFLMDFGSRYGSMHADITRTFPVKGKFNPLQSILYNIVQNAQSEVEKVAKEGVTIDHLNEVCWNYINDELSQKILKQGGKMELAYENAPHGVSHLMGEMEHDGDPFGAYKNEKMRTGWMISNEPGVYGYFELKIKGKKYKGHIGIRIEDNLIITKKGCINLSRNIPKSIKEIERLMSKY